MINNISLLNQSLLNSKKLLLIQKLNYKGLLECDVESIKKMISIFLQIAISNSYKNTNIEIKISKLFNKVQFVITYQGKTFSEEEFCRLFSKPSRFTSVGHGIKMDFCKKKLEFHNGTLEFKHSSWVNIFIFTLPILQRRNRSKPFSMRRLQIAK